MEIPLQRYSPGGDIYQQVAQEYGQAAADKLYAAAQTGSYANIVEANAEIHNDGPIQDRSTVDAFLNQITTDPLAAPLASANKLVGNTFASFFKSPWVLTVIVGGLALWLIGPETIKKSARKLLGK